MSFWGQTLEIARVDLRVERRLGDTLRIVLPFAVVALMVFPLSLGIELAVIRRCSGRWESSSGCKLLSASR